MLKAAAVVVAAFENWLTCRFLFILLLFFFTIVFLLGRKNISNNIVSLAHTEFMLSFNKQNRSLLSVDLLTH